MTLPEMNPDLLIGVARVLLPFGIVTSAVKAAPHSHAG
jgi:hypothetical protein